MSKSSLCKNIAKSKRKGYLKTTVFGRNGKNKELDNYKENPTVTDQSEL